MEFKTMTGPERSQLIKLLGRAANGAPKKNGRIRGEGGYFDKDLGESLTDAARRLSRGDDSVLKELWSMFSPSGDWDAQGGQRQTGEMVFERINRLWKHADFPVYAD